MSKNRGFTLIELMIVVVIIAVLAMIAYPSYQEQVRKSRRNQAKADLMELTQALERKFTADRDYSTPAFTFPMTKSPRDAVDGKQYYDLSFVAAPTVGRVRHPGRAREHAGHRPLRNADNQQPWPEAPQRGR